MARPADDTGFECNICLGIPEAEINQCHGGHIFCADCLASHRDAGQPNSNRCPVCRALLPTEVCRNRVAELAIGQLSTQCPHCHDAMCRRDLAEHVEQCDSRPASCSAAHEGCGWAGRRRDQAAHEAGCTFAICSRMLSPLRQENERLRRRCSLLEAQLLTLQPISTSTLPNGCLSLGPIMDGHALRALDGGSFYTVGLPQMRLTDGRWYFEVEILEDLDGHPLQLGWCNSDFGLPPDQTRIEASKQRGVGDCSNSWGFDGSRRQRYHNFEDDPEMPACGALGPRTWRFGDVIGMEIDLDAARPYANCMVNGRGCQDDRREPHSPPHGPVGRYCASPSRACAPRG